MAKSKSKTMFVCQNCGNQRPKWEGHCTDCGSWNSFVEEVTELNKGRGWIENDGEALAFNLEENLSELQFERYATSYSEIDRVLGGGMVKGSFVLLGGAPGVGKSTILLQTAGGLARHNHKVLYVSGEESVEQTGSRAHRLGIRSNKIEVSSINNLTQILALTRTVKPTVLVIDSIQTVFLPELASAPGSVSQVRECAAELMTLAKQEHVTVILVGHITKDGSIAGPKVLEHMVDTVLSFEGDMNYQFRLLRCMKNRFGPVNELGVFQMSTRGLEEVKNPSELFLEEREGSVCGSAVFSSMEGSRPLLCEIQALCTPTPMAMPRRTALGIDVNRVHLIAAVLGRHLNSDFSHSDIYINVVGGLKIIEPAADLAVAAALISNESRMEINGRTCFFGEIGLTGEIRTVSFAEQRIKEAEKLGFTNYIVPFSNKKNLADLKLDTNKKIFWIKHVQQLPGILQQQQLAEAQAEFSKQL